MKLRITMRNLLTAMFAVVFVLGAGVEASNAQYTGTGTFNKITSIDDLTDGYYVVTQVNNTPAMSNSHNGTLLAPVAATIASDQIINPATTIVWKIETNGDGRSIYSEASEKFISYTGTSNNIQVVDGVTTDNQRWNITFTSNEFVFANVAVPARILQYNPGAPRFVTYTTNQQKFDLYRLEEAEGAVLTPSTGALESFSYTQNEGPSSSQSFTIAGADLTPADATVTITAPSNFEVSLDDETFSGSVTVDAIDGEISTTTIHVRLSAGLGIDSYNGAVTIAGGDASTQVTVSGEVLPDHDFLETFETANFNLTASYTDGSFEGVTAVTWTYVASRNQGAQPINGDNAIMLRRTADNSSLTSSTISGGIQEFSVLLRKGFTGGGNRQVELLIGPDVDNLTSFGTSVAYDVNDEIRRFTVSDINYVGDFVLRIRNTTGNQIVIDDVSWSSYQDGKLTITGAAGWRMLSAPVQNMPISVFDGKAGIQGFDNDGFIRNLYTGYDGTNWTPSGDNSTAKPTTFESGRGIMLYLYDNDQAGSTPIGDGLEITASGVSPSEDVVVSVHQDGDHKINFLGNPFNEPILVSELKSDNGEFLANVLVYDHEDGFISSSDEIKLDGKIAPWQGFLLGNTDATSITIPTSAKTTGGNFLKENRNWSQLQFILSSVDGENVQIRDRSIIVQLREEEELDRFELPKMSPMSQPSAMMYFADNTQEQTRIMGQVARSNEIPNRVEIPFDVVSYNAGERFRIEWPLLRDIPEDIEFFILDTLTGEEIPLTDGTYFDFVIDATEMAKSDGLIAEADVASSSTRFKLVGENARTTSLENADQMPSEVALAQNFPNPFNPTTRISYQLPAESQVRLAVYDLLGRQVAVLVNDRMAPGSHFVNFNAESLSSGVYVYRLEASGVVLTQKMTLVK